jgi:hypothetical protein
MRAILSLVAVTVLAGGIWVAVTVARRPSPVTASAAARISDRSGAAARAGATEPGGATDPSLTPGTRLEFVRLLRARNFSALTRAIETKQAKVERDIRQEGDFATAVLPSTSPTRP